MQNQVEITETRTIARNFIHKIARDNRIDLIPFDRTRWFRGAYSTLQRTLKDRYHPLSVDQKRQLEDLIFDEVLRDRKYSLDDLELFVGQIAERYCISVGHSQKLLGMLSKYAYVVNYSSLGSIPPDLQAYLEINLPILPVPIDNFVLSSLLKQHGPHFKDIVKRGSSFRVCDSTGECPWSKMNRTSTWRSLQIRIQEIARIQSQSPMEFEMRNLWIP